MAKRIGRPKGAKNIIRMDPPKLAVKRGRKIKIEDNRIAVNGILTQILMLSPGERGRLMAALDLIA